MQEPASPLNISSKQRRAAELQALYWITQAANFAMPVDDIMELIYTQIQRVMPTPNFYIAFANPEEKNLSYAFYIEENQRLYPEEVWSFQKGLTGLIVSKGITIRTDDYLSECRARGVEAGGKPGRAWMGAPLLAQDQTIGALVVSAYDPDVTFSEEDENFFVTVASYTASAIERRRLHERLEAHAHQLDTLNQVGQLLSSSLDLDEVLDLVVRHAARLLSGEAGSLLLLDDDSGDLIFRISSGPAGKKLIGLKIPAGKGIAGTCFAENQTIIVNDTQHDKRWYNYFDQSGEFATHSLIAVPLNARGRSIGVLEVLNHQDKRPFSAEDADLLLSFGAQAAMAIENARLFTMTDQALQAHIAELTTLQHIDRQLNATLDYRQVMGLTLSWGLRITGATIGLIAALREDENGRQGLQFLAYEGYPDDIVGQYTEEELWPLDKGLVGATVQLGKTLLTQDVAQDPRYAPVVAGMQAQLSIPIRRENRVVGVIALESPEAGCFSEEKVELVTRLADHAAIAIDNARLFQQLQQANQAKTDFVSFVSHELKQPMTSMKGYTDLLIKEIGGPLNDQQQQFLQVIRSNMQRMDRLVSDLLDISRIEAGRLRLDMQNTQPEDVTREALRAFEQAIAQRGQSLEVKIEPELPAIHGDRGRLIQVLTNLLSNANKYTPEGGRIAVRVGRWNHNGQDYVRWSVQDTGIGMTTEEREKLFTKYFRSDNPIVRNVKGTGLGLAISHSIIEMHGGQVLVASEPGEGSTFSFAIPVA